MSDQPHDVRLPRWAHSIEDVDREIARLALLCGVRILDPGAIGRVLQRDASVCGTDDRIAFEKLRALLIMHFSIRERAVKAYGESRTVVVEASVASDGQPIVHELRYRANSGGKSHRKLILQAVEAGMKVWKFHPEIVTGQSLPTRLSVPVIFCLETAWCSARQQEAKAFTRTASSPSTIHLAPSSAVALKTRIATPGS